VAWLVCVGARCTLLVYYIECDVARRALNVACSTLYVSRGVLCAARTTLAHLRRVLCTSTCSEPHLATLFYAYGGVEAAQRQLEEWVEWHSQVQSIPLEYC
jgi:hypothetical protein